MAHKIDKKITNWSIKKEPDQIQPEPLKPKEYDIMGEHIKRAEKLNGSTIKIKSPNTESAVFVTINHIVLNQGTEFEKIYPYEVFIQSKDNDHMQWVNVLARAISALLREGKDISFFITEMKETHSPRSGYMKKGKFIPSLVADIGYTLEEHFFELGYLKKEDNVNIAKEILAQKGIVVSETKGDYPSHAQECKECGEKAAIMMDGCVVCLACGSSKCS